MPRRPRIQYPGAIYHGMSRGDGRPLWLRVDRLLAKGGMRKLDKDKAKARDRIMAAVCFMMILLCGCSPRVEAPRAYTQVRLKNCRLVIGLLEREKGVPFFDQLNSSSGKATLHQRWVSLVQHNAKILKIEGTDFQREYGQDAWGRAFNTELGTQIRAEGRNAARLEVGGGLCMWSSGPDGINDYGEKDDVVVPASTE